MGQAKTLLVKREEDEEDGRGGHDGTDHGGR